MESSSDIRSFCGLFNQRPSCDPVVLVWYAQRKWLTRVAVSEERPEQADEDLDQQVSNQQFFLVLNILSGLTTKEIEALFCCVGVCFFTKHFN